MGSLRPSSAFTLPAPSCSDHAIPIALTVHSICCFLVTIAAGLKTRALLFKFLFRHLWCTDGNFC